MHKPREKYSLHHLKVLDKYLPVVHATCRFHCVGDTQVNGTLKGRGCGLRNE